MVTASPWPFSWPHPESIYVDAGPPLKRDQLHVETVYGIEFELRVTGFGCDTFRARYEVTCRPCGVVLHPGTTGPSERILDHLKEWHP